MKIDQILALEQKKYLHTDKDSITVRILNADHSFNSINIYSVSTAQVASHFYTIVLKQQLHHLSAISTQAIVHLN